MQFRVCLDEEHIHRQRCVVLSPMMRLTSSPCRGLARPRTKVSPVLLSMLAASWFFFNASDPLWDKIWTPSMETRCFGVESDPRGPVPNIYQSGLWGQGILPLRGTFCHLCCVQSPRIHYSGPSETPSSLPWNAPAVQHLLQSTHPSGERQLETKQAENEGGGDTKYTNPFNITSITRVQYTDTHTQSLHWESAAHLCIWPALNFYSWILSKPYHLWHLSKGRWDRELFYCAKPFPVWWIFVVSFSSLDCRLHVPIEDVPHFVLSFHFFWTWHAITTVDSITVEQWLQTADFVN